mmetsp:Transcript_5094/g.7305  ORF Transcript_5094/g.7305 Transcript_5094/m.7305 type:complete len:338 (+) Transcript_5094:253-1266(+)
MASRRACSAALRIASASNLNSACCTRAISAGSTPPLSAAEMALLTSPVSADITASSMALTSSPCRISVLIFSRLCLTRSISAAATPAFFAASSDASIRSTSLVARASSMAVTFCSRKASPAISCSSPSRACSNFDSCAASTPSWRASVRAEFKRAASFELRASCKDFTISALAASTSLCFASISARSAAALAAATRASSAARASASAPALSASARSVSASARALASVAACLARDSPSASSSSDNIVLASLGFCVLLRRLLAGAATLDRTAPTLEALPVPEMLRRSVPPLTDFLAPLSSSLRLDGVMTEFFLVVPGAAGTESVAAVPSLDGRGDGVDG